MEAHREPPSPVSSVTETGYHGIFLRAWLARGYSRRCVDRMWEINQGGTPDRVMLDMVKQEGLV